MAQFYLPSSGALYTDETLLINTGFPPTAAPSALAANGIYTVTPTPDPYDPLLYTTEPTFAIVGDYANESWVATPLPLPTAKVNATAEVKEQSNNSADVLVTSSGVNLDIWTGAASQLAVDRPPLYNTLLGEMAAIGDSLAASITAIDSATTVDELNNIVNPPSGILNTGRGAGLGPEDLNLSYFTIFNSTTLTPADIELYVPGTSTVIPYDAGLPAPYTFDSVGSCFASGDYELQIRVAATSAVIATLTIPLAVVTNVDIAFNNPTIPPSILSVTSGSITGTAQVGSTLTYTPGVTSGGTAPITTSWIWKRGLTTVGITSSTTYVPVAGDVGSVITVVITATDYTLNTASATTAPTAAVTYSSTTFNVTNNESGNYVINGASNPTLTLAGGITYTFNISAPGHPFWIKTTQTTGTGDQYNTGVTNNGTDNGVITFVAPLTVEAFTLYYNCQYHASMAGVLNMLP